MRYFIELSYNGKAYHGWQVQPNAITVQEVLESALSTLLKDKISVVGAGRTDAGVHAHQMYAHFDADLNIALTDLVHKLNAFLPKDIGIYNIYKMKDEAHARFDAVSRSYIYKISMAKDVFNYDYTYHFKLPLAIDKMNEACKILFDYTNFKCFSRSNTDVKTYNCKMMYAEWKKDNDTLIFSIKADRFLRNMVRAIVGTMIDIGLGKTSLAQFHEIIKSGDRTQAGASVPGHALYLSKIEYPKSLFK